LNHAAKKGLVRPAIDSPRVKEAPVEWATPEYVRSCCPTVRPPKLTRFVVLIVYTGCRLAEALRLDWDRDIDLNGRHITFRRTKNGKMRTAPYPRRPAGRAGQRA
jgi:integrase